MIRAGSFTASDGVQSQPRVLNGGSGNGRAVQVRPLACATCPRLRLRNPFVSHFCASCFWRSVPWCTGPAEASRAGHGPNVHSGLVNHLCIDRAAHKQPMSYEPAPEIPHEVPKGTARCVLGCSRFCWYSAVSNLFLCHSQWGSSPINHHWPWINRWTQETASIINHQPKINHQGSRYQPLVHRGGHEENSPMAIVSFSLLITIMIIISITSSW